MVRRFSASRKCSTSTELMRRLILLGAGGLSFAAQPQRIVPVNAFGRPATHCAVEIRERSFEARCDQGSGEGRLSSEPVQIVPVRPIHVNSDHRPPLLEITVERAAGGTAAVELVGVSVPAFRSTAGAPARFAVPPGGLYTLFVAGPTRSCVATVETSASTRRWVVQADTCSLTTDQYASVLSSGEVCESTRCSSWRKAREAEDRKFKEALERLP